MVFTVTEGAFTTEEDAMAQIAARGWHGLTLDVGAGPNDWHWHDFDSVLFFVSGIMHIEMEDGTRHDCGPGSRLEAPRELVHREWTDGYRMVVGLSVDPAELTQPINKPVAQRV